MDVVTVMLPLVAPGQEAGMVVEVAVHDEQAVAAQEETGQAASL